MDLMGPLLRSDGIAVQRIDHRIAVMLVPVVAGRKKNNDVAIDSITLQVALKRCAMDLYVLHSVRFCVRNRIGDLCLYLRGQWNPKGKDCSGSQGEGHSWLSHGKASSLYRSVECTTSSIN